MNLMKIVTTALLTTALSNVALAQSAEVDVSLTPAGDFVAKTSDIKGSVKQKGDSVMAENVVVSLKNLKTGISLRDKHARDKYLEVNKYPTMTLVKAIGKNGKGKGRIRYRGVQKDVTGTYKINGNKLDAEFPLKLSDFKINGIKYMGVGVDDVVKVRVSLPIAK